MVRVGGFVRRVDGKSGSDESIQDVREGPVVVGEFHVLFLPVETDIEFAERGVVVERSVRRIVDMMPRELLISEARLPFRNNENNAFAERPTYVVKDLEKFFLPPEADKDK